MYDSPEVSINFANFSWRKSNVGYTWENNICIDELFSKKTNEKPPYIMPVPETTSFITTNPLQEVEYYAFARFAELCINDSETAKEEIIKFANEYGLLTHDLFLDNDNFANSLSFWCQQIWIAKNIFRIWQAINKKDTSFLSKVIMVNKDNIYYIFGEPEDIDIYCTEGIKRDRNGILTDIKGMFVPSKRSVLAEQNKFILNNVKSNDYIFPAQLVLQKVINEQLEEFPVHPRLLFDKYNQLTQFFMPTSLLAAMWFQMFQIITDEKKNQTVFLLQTLV